MSHAWIPLVLLAVTFVLAGVCALLGWGADSRDPAYGVGRMLGWRPERSARRRRPR